MKIRGKRGHAPFKAASRYGAKLKSRRDLINSRRDLFKSRRDSLKSRRDLIEFLKISLSRQYAGLSDYKSLYESDFLRRNVEPIRLGL